MKKIKYKELTLEEKRSICKDYYKPDGTCSKECPFYRSRHSKGKEYQRFCYPILENLELLTEEDKEMEIEIP